MASYTISNTNTSVTFNVSGLKSGDSVRLYVRYDSSSTTVVDFYYTATGTTLSRTFTIPSKSSYAANCNVNDSWLGAKYFTTGSDTPSKTRPSNWYWSTTPVSGNTMRMSANEWNSFCKRINEFRDYKNVGAYSFTTVSSGQKMMAWQANEARTAINGISGHGTLPASAVSGTSVTAYFFTQLASALNAIS